MQFSKIFIVEDSEPMVRFYLGRLLRSADYQLQPDGSYQRGSRQGSQQPSDPSKWDTRLLTDTRSTPEFYTRVVLSYDVKTNGQDLEFQHRQFWVDEVEWVVAELGGREEGDQNLLQRYMSLDVSLLENPAAAQAANQGFRSLGRPAVQPQHAPQMKAGANWFFWIAGLALINPLSSIIDANLSLPFGLGVPQLVGAASSLLIEPLPEWLALLRGSALLVNLLILAGLGFFGWAGREGKGWAFAVGMGVYFADAMICMLVGDWLAVTFHAIALYGLGRGYQAYRQLYKVQSKQAIG